MREKEKMLKGEFFFPGDEELSKLSKASLDLCWELNNIKASHVDEQLKIERQIVNKLGNNSYIRPPFYVDYGFNISIGDNFFSNFNLKILDAGHVTIGNNVMIGPNCTIITVSHPIHYEDRNTLLEFGRDIVIEDNVWIASNVTINPGVTIGENSVIGSGSLITKDVPKNSLVFGVPAKVIREITKKDRIDLKRDL